MCDHQNWATRYPEDPHPQYGTSHLHRYSDFEADYVAGWRLLNTFANQVDPATGHLPKSLRPRAEEAIQHLKKCIEAEPENWQCAWGLGQACRALEQHEEALSWFSMASEKCGKDVKPIHAAAAEALFLGDTARALDFAVRSVETAPHETQSHIHHAHALLISGQIKEALAVAEVACSVGTEIGKALEIFHQIQEIDGGTAEAPTTVG